ncbi:hypothetical protein BJ983_005481 [Actinomycetospora corticicola]|uniref:Uncharacterized protein n=1 Tax=Actinomycetospora corticicola TaxID=663602 RepID=A0A7Y9E191_9PSEU|nr:hypothetical protein [Actinomycetospora corticicola]
MSPWRRPGFTPGVMLLAAAPVVFSPLLRDELPPE